MMMLKKSITLFLPFLMIISCASSEEKLQNIKDYVEKISAEIKFEDGFNSIKVKGEKRSRFRSYYQNDEIVFINEDMNIGNRGDSANKYFFRNGELVYYKEDTIVLKDDSLNISGKSIIRIEIYFDGTNVLHSVRTIKGLEMTLRNEEINSIIEHSKILKELADINRPTINNTTNN